MDAVRRTPRVTVQRPGRRGPPLLPLVGGLVAGVALVALYLGIVTVAQSWSHATNQLAADRWWVGAIVAGFGVQVGLFVYLRQLHARAVTGGVALSAGTSTAAMVACCAHHLSDVLPIIGVSGAAVFLNQYKTSFLILGVVMNAGSIAYLAWKVRQMWRFHPPAY